MYLAEGESYSGDTVLVAVCTLQEAHLIVKSLMKQILAGSPNVGRTEFIVSDVNPMWFSIAVEDEPQPNIGAGRWDRN